MADWPLRGDGQRYKNYGTVLGTTRGTTITAGAANTKGLYSQITASTDYAGMPLVSVGRNSQSYGYLVDIAIGASGSEQIIISNLLPGDTRLGLKSCYSILFPVIVPAGSRIAARCQCQIGGGILDVMVTIVGTGYKQPSSLSRVDDYGAVTADSGGTAITITSANTKGSWVEITASSNKIEELLIGFYNTWTQVSADGFWFFDIAIGASGSEVVIIPNIPLWLSANEFKYPDFVGPIPCSIPAGSRIAVRAQSSQTITTNLDIVLYGIR